METKSNTLCVIPARSGSERVPGKNLEKLDGKSLVSLANMEAVNAGIFSDIVVSSDCKSMADGLQWVDRPKDISGPNADIADAVKHALLYCEKKNNIQYDYVVTLQPTIPLRSATVIKNLWERVIANKCRGGLTGVEIVPWIWNADKGAAENGWYPGPYPRSQSFGNKKFWQEINCVQVCDRATSLGGKRWGLPLAIELLPSFATLDIDTWEDLQLARSTYRKLRDAFDAAYVSNGFVVNTINR